MSTAKSKTIIERFSRAQDSLVIQAADMSLETIAAMVDAGAIDVQPEYQRRERWSLPAQSALIESFLLNIPVPPVYLAEEDFGTYSVIDGKQRLTAIKRFMRQEFSLFKPARFEELNGLQLSELPIDLRNALTIRPYVRVVTLLKQSDPQLKYEVFTRLNTGGVPLQPQEVRNAMYRGKLNDMLIQLSEQDFLRKQLKIKTKKEDAYLSMSDVEYVLRFFTMLDEWKSFSGDYRRSMDRYMDLNRNPTAAKLKRLRSLYIACLERCQALWGDHAFRRFDVASNVYRDQFLSALYDAQMIAVSGLTEAKFNKLVAKRQKVVSATRALFGVSEFEDSIRVSTNTPIRVKTRVEMMVGMLAELG
ncbi:hypothetical protein DM81_1974 [Burkholderia multivorans]|uniref:DUF262 domain-containing protein n=1 Tax=Burkholderia multivorans TaxID=87883 RepID=UPI00050EE828|nr:DUF262 domain-containing protein [Burkholderia multivorans]KGB90399.1 hypothetical protein DM81_1974 [Burkholderia multivorans]